MRSPRLVLFAAPSLLVSLIAPGDARAQGQPRAAASASAPASAPAPTAAPPPAEPVDLVRFKNGGLVRGTILELVPGDTVVIRTATGDVRKIPMADVTYAGAASAEKTAPTPAPTPAPPPAAPAPAPAPKPAASPARSPANSVRPMVTVHAGEAKFSFESEVPQSTLYVETAAVASGSGYERLCTAPCAATVAEGNYRFAMAEGSKKWAPFSRSVDIRNGDTIRVTRESRSGIRTGFALGGLGGLGVGLPMIALGDKGSTTKTVGYVLLAGSAIAFLGALATPDQTHFTVVPGVPGGDEPDPRSGRVSARPPASPRQEITSSWQGLTAIGRF